MQVIVKGRREGKTTSLVKWLLLGNLQEGYPQWSRVIVSPTQSMVVHTSKMIAHQLGELGAAFLCSVSRPHLREGCTITHKHTSAQIRKAVWSPRAFNFNVAGGREFEYAIDDLDEFIRNQFYGRMPAVITVTGEAVDDLGN